MSFAVDYGGEETAVSTPPTSSILQNRNLLIGIGALVLIAIVVVVVTNLDGSDGQFGGDEGLATKIDTLVTNSQAPNQLFFDEGLSGWQVNSSQAVVAEEAVQIGPDSILVRDRTFAPGQGILLDFFMSEVSSNGGDGL